MNKVTLESFMDELHKIAANFAFGGGSVQNVVAKPASVSTGQKAMTQLKVPSKPTSYSMVHSNQPQTGYGVSGAMTSAPPPPVRV